jgi:hypothetical protein
MIEYESKTIIITLKLRLKQEKNNKLRSLSFFPSSTDVLKQEFIAKKMLASTTAIVENLSMFKSRVTF